MAIKLVTSATAVKGDTGGTPSGALFTGTVSVSAVPASVLIVAANVYNSVAGGMTGLRLGSSSGPSFTRIGTVADAGTSFAFADLWYLLNPTPGTYQLFVESSYAAGTLVASLWSGVDQTTPIGANASSVNQATPNTLRVLCPTGGVVLDCYSTANNTAQPTPNAAQTVVASLDYTGATGYGNGLTHSYRFGAGTTPMTYTGGSANPAFKVAVLNPAKQRTAYRTALLRSSSVLATGSGIVVGTPASAQVTPAWDGVSAFTGSAPFTVTAGQNLLSVQLIGFSASSVSGISLKFNGVPLTCRAVRDSGDVVNSSIWDLLNPSVGTFSLTMNTGGAERDVAINMVALSGVDPITPFGATGTGSTYGNETTTVATRPGDLVIEATGTEATASSPGASQTVMVSNLAQPGTTNRLLSASYAKATSGSQTMSWTNSVFGCIAAVVYRAAAPAGSFNSVFQTKSPTKRTVYRTALLRPLTVVHYYVDTASTTGGDGTTPATSGTTRAYPTLNACLTARMGNLVGGNQQVVVHCAASTGLPDTAFVDWDSLPATTTDAGHYLTIQVDAPNRHRGAWDNSKYRLENNGYQTIRNLPAYSRIYGLQLYNRGDDNSMSLVFAPAGTITIGYCLGKFEQMTRTYGATSYAVFLGSDFTNVAQTSTVFNNVFYDLNVGPNKGIKALSAPNSYVRAYNNTFIGPTATVDSTSVGISDGYTRIDARNNILVGWATPSTAAAAGTSNNATDGPAMGSSVGAYNRTGVRFTFVNPAAGNYRLIPGDTTARGYGANLTTAPSPVLDSVDGTPRMFPFDVGAFQTPTKPRLYRTALLKSQTVATSLGTRLDVGTRFVYDSFTGQDGASLDSRLGELGAQWAVHPAYNTFSGYLKNNQLEAQQAQTAYFVSGVPPTPDYFVQSDMFAADSTDSAAGICGRMDTVANTLYLLRFNGTAGQWQLYSGVAGSFTLIGTFTDTLPAGTTKTARLSMVGSSIKAYVNDVLVISVTDTSVTAAGRAGIRYSNGASSGLGVRFDNFIASDLVPYRAVPVFNARYSQSTRRTAYRTALLRALTGGGSPYTLPAAQNTYVITVQGTGLAVQRRLPLVTGSYVVTPVTVPMTFARKLLAMLQTYTVTPTATTLRWAHKLLLATAAVVVGTTTTTLGAGRKLLATLQSYVVTPTATPMTFARRVVATAQSYLVTGTSTTLAAARKLVSTVQPYTVTPVATLLRVGHKVALATAAYVITTTGVALTYGQHGAYTLPVAAAVYLLGTLGVTLRSTRRMPVPTSTYVLTMTPVAPSFARRLLVGTQAVTVATVAAPLRALRKLLVTTQVVLVAGTSTTLASGRKLASAVAAVAVTPVSSLLQLARKVVVTAASYAVGALTTTLRSVRVLPVTPPGYTINGFPVSFGYARLIIRDASLRGDLRASARLVGTLRGGPRLRGDLHTYPQ